MRVQKGHKVQLLPNNEQRSRFVQWAGAHRWAYNFGLERKIESYKAGQKSPGAYALMKEIVALKREPDTAWLKDAPKSVPRVALIHLDKGLWPLLPPHEERRQARFSQVQEP